MRLRTFTAIPKKNAKAPNTIRSISLSNIILYRIIYDTSGRNLTG